MGLDQLALFVIQAARLVQDGQRNVGLSDVVKHRGKAETLHVLRAKPQAEPEIRGDAGNKETVLVGSLMMITHGVEPGGEAVFSDAIDNRAPHIRRGLDVDGKATHRRVEHGGDVLGGSGSNSYPLRRVFEDVHFLGLAGPAPRREAVARLTCVARTVVAPNA